jgi:hypothetical protein
MKFRVTYLLFLFFLSSIKCFPQSDSLIVKKRSTTNLTISYNSSLIYPGTRIGIELPVYNVDITRGLKTGKAKSISKERFVTAEAGWYHHPHFHDNLYFTLEWTMKRTKESGFFTQFSFGPGYSRTFLGGTTYVIDNGGNVSIIKSAGYNYVMIFAGGGIGVNLAGKIRMPVSVLYKLDILMMYPYNSTLYFRPVMELGIIYRPADFLPLITKTRKVSR